jgi:hypothetical protein
MLSATATLFPGVLPDGTTCAQDLSPLAPPVLESQICLQTLNRIFSSKCAATLQLTPCVCGSTNASTCLAGTAVPTGPLYDEYACDFNTISGGVINQDFVIPNGAGTANSIMECAAAFECDCF